MKFKALTRTIIDVVQNLDGRFGAMYSRVASALDLDSTEACKFAPYDLGERELHMMDKTPIVPLVGLRLLNIPSRGLRGLQSIVIEYVP